MIFYLLLLGSTFLMPNAWADNPAYFCLSQKKAIPFLVHKATEDDLKFFLQSMYPNRKKNSDKATYEKTFIWGPMFYGSVVTEDTAAKKINEFYQCQDKFICFTDMQQKKTNYVRNKKESYLAISEKFSTKCVDKGVDKDKKHHVIGILTIKTREPLH